MSFVERFRLVFRLLALVTLVIPWSQVASAKEQAEWLIYLYMVGSDLEAGRGDYPGGAATIDISEIGSSKIGKNVHFLLMTGGANDWKNELISSKKSQIYDIRDGNANLVFESAPMNMGLSSTLAEFIKVGEEIYAPKHRMIIFWDHGGGPAKGVGYDQIFNNDYLNMKEISDAFAMVFGDTYKPFDVIGFDACLMASLPVAYAMSPWGHTMVASEETEPGTGWFYTPWLDALEAKPNMSLKELGANIISSYVQACNEIGQGDELTLSSTSLDALPELMIAYNNMGSVMMDVIGSNPKKLLNDLERAAKQSESYGTNDKSDQDFTDSIDLLHYVNNLKSYAPEEANAVIKALDAYVLDNYNGPMKQSSGISVYYPIGKLAEQYDVVMLNGPSVFELIHAIAIMVTTGQVGTDEKQYDNYVSIIEAANDNMVAQMERNKGFSNYAEDYGMSGGSSTTETDIEVDPDAGQVAENDNKPGEQSGIKPNTPTSPTLMTAFSNAAGSANTAAESQRTDFASLENIKINFDKDYNSFVKVPKKLLDAISYIDIVVLLYQLPNEQHPKGLMVTVGSDVKINEDWENGIFTDTMDGTWPALDGHILPLVVTNVSDDFVIYECSVKINGYPYNLNVAYSFETKKYSILGAQRVSEDGVPDRITKRLKPGDKITTLFDVDTLLGEGEEDSREIEMDTFTYTEKSKIEDMNMGKSDMVFAFNFNDGFGNSATSELVALSINEKDELYLERFDDKLKSLTEEAEGETESAE